MSYKTGNAYLKEIHTNECDYEEGDGCPLVIALPHSCDAWIVGNADEARLMATELLALADRVKVRQ